MKHRVKPDWLNPFKIIFLAVFTFLSFSFFCFIGLCIILAFTDIELDLFLDDYGVIISIILICLAVCILFASYSSDKLTKYQVAAGKAYIWSIREALRTEYPHGIVYILESTLQQLQKLGINHQPYSFIHKTQENDSSDYVAGERYGFPNQTHLKEAIKMAYQLSKKWENLEKIDTAQSSKYMIEIRSLIKKEEIYLDRNKIELSNINLYYFSYDEADYQAENKSKNNSYQSSRVSNKHPEQDYHLENISNNTHNSNILDFHDWLAQNSALQYVSELEQEKAYARYTQSFEIDEEKPYYS